MDYRRINSGQMNIKWTDGQEVDGWINGHIEEKMDGRTGGWKEGWMEG